MHEQGVRQFTHSISLTYFANSMRFSVTFLPIFKLKSPKFTKPEIESQCVNDTAQRLGFKLATQTLFNKRLADVGSNLISIVSDNEWTQRGICHQNL